MAASAPGPKTSPSPPATSPPSSKSTLSPHPRLFPILVSSFCLLVCSFPWTYKFTIDKRSDLRQDCACHLEETSPTPPSAPALTLVLSIAWSLFAFFFRLPSFVFNSLQPLFAKHPGWGYPFVAAAAPKRKNALL